MPTWQFAPHPVTREAASRGAPTPRVVEALRSGHGLGAAFELEWRAGPCASLLLHAPDPVASRWIGRVVTLAYGSDAWSAVPTMRHPGPALRAALLGRRIGPAGASLPDDEPSPWSDAILPALTTFRTAIACRWRLRPADLPLPTEVPVSAGTPAYLAPGMRPPPPTDAFRLQEERRERDRRSPRWLAQVWIEADPTALRSGEAARFSRLITAASSNPGCARIEFRGPRPIVDARPARILLTEREVAGLLPGPTARFTPGPRSTSPAGPSLDLGGDGLGGRVRLHVEPHEGRHLAVLGETGMGKSSMLVSLALAAARLGNVVLFDPIGDTGRAFLVRLPAARRDDVVWISPSASPVPIDLLEPLRAADRTEAARDRALSDVISALRRVRSGRFPEGAFWGPRIEETLRRTLAATAAIPTASLADAVALLSNAACRPSGIPPEARAAVEALVERVRERPEEVDGSRRLLGELTDRPVLRELLGQRDAPFRIRDAFLPRRITVLCGDAAAVGESAARYLLAVHLALCWSERLASPGSPKTFLVLDEAQWYAHETVAEILRLGRRENLHLVLATQGLTSLPEEVREAVRTNASDLVAFRGSPEDARELHRIAPWIAIERWTALPRGHAIALLGKGAEVRELRRTPPLPISAEEGERCLAELAERALASTSLGGEATPIGQGSDQPDGSPSPNVRAMLLALWGWSMADPLAAEVAVPLEPLRRAFDPTGEEVRRLGGRLRDAGVLRRAARGASGQVWWLGRDDLGRLVGPSVDAGELAEALARFRAARAEPARGREPGLAHFY
jgi:hypothetical protein